MNEFGTKVPMERTANGFRTLEGDDLLENVVQFFIGTFASAIGNTGECPWDHAFGSPWEMMRHLNVKSGMTERYVSLTHERFKKYAGNVVRLTACERYVEIGKAVHLRFFWRNVKTGRVPEEATDVEFAE